VKGRLLLTGALFLFAQTQVRRRITSALGQKAKSDPQSQEHEAAN
jgi:hypothetical protein